MSSSTAQFRARLVIVGGLSMTMLLGACAAPPKPEISVPVDESLPASPITDRLVTCMADEGWTVTRSLEGGVMGPSNISEAQLEKYNEASEKCGKESGWSDAWQSLTDAQLRQLYDQEVDEQRCLADLGYVGEEPPSEQTYLDTFMTPNQYYAFTVIDDLHRSDWEAAVRECPPPTLYLNLDGL